MAGDAEQALLEERVLAVPERERKVDAAVVVRDAADAVLAPAVRARARVLVREVRPGVAVGRVVLADGGLRAGRVAGAARSVLASRAGQEEEERRGGKDTHPLALAQVRSPALPVRSLLGVLLEPPLLDRRVAVTERVEEPLAEGLLESAQREGAGQLVVRQATATRLGCLACAQARRPRRRGALLGPGAR